MKQTPRTIFRVAAMLAALSLAAACTTVGDIPVSLSEADVVHISPANQDGVQDVVTFPLSVELLERTRLARVEMTVTAERGEAVRQELVDYTGVRGRMRSRGDESNSPEAVVWDGRGDDGEFVPDGEYSLRVQVWDNGGNSGFTGDQRVVVDNTPPSLSLSVPALVFSPNGDGVRDTLEVRQEDSSDEDRWIGTFADATGADAREFVWLGRAGDFSWDGTRRDGSLSPEGIYSYTVRATDFAGNTSTYAVAGLVLEREVPAVGLTLSRRAFSPNGDGRADSIQLRPSVATPHRATRWWLTLSDESGQEIRRFSGTETPRDIEYDGSAEDGSLLPDGPYTAVFAVTYDDGRELETTPQTVVIDTAAPQSIMTPSTPVISPDGDGRLDAVVFRQSSTSETEWIGSVSNARGTVVRSWAWVGHAEDVEWDGTGQSGSLLPDGTYTYDLSSVDEAGNPSPPATASVRIDTRPVSVRILPGQSRISPNNDGISDMLTFGLFSDVAGGIDRWSVALSDSRGVAMGTIAGGAQGMPSSFEWAGRLDGATLPDGLYYPELTAEYANGTIAAALSPPVRVDTSGPDLTVGFRTIIYGAYETGTEGEEGEVELGITIVAVEPSGIDEWRLVLRDPDGRVFTSWEGEGRPPTLISWSGVSDSGEPMTPNADYRIVMTAVDSVGNSGSGEADATIDLVVTPDGNELRLSNIYFGPNTAEFRSLDRTDLVARNAQALDQLASLLERYPNYRLRIEGHATHLLSFDPLRAQTEHLEILVPLSFARAEAIRDELIARGIAASRIDVWGHGGIHPVVPHSDVVNRWLNRRVEFFLQRR